jgi:hypothetical protein
MCTRVRLTAQEKKVRKRRQETRERQNAVRGTDNTPKSATSQDSFLCLLHNKETTSTRRASLDSFQTLAQCTNCGLGLLCLLPLEIREIVYEQVLEDRGFSIEHVFVYNARYFKIQKLFERRDAN